MYKRALNAFFLKVHPDFFHHNHQQQTVNENAVAQLNELLSWAKEFREGTLRSPPSTRIEFTFYRKADETGTTQARSSLAQRGHTDTADETLVINSTFELPENFAASEAHRGLVERSVNKFLRDLLRRAECIDGVTESISSAADATAARLEAKPLRRRPHARGKTSSSSRPKSLLDEATEALSMQWTVTPVPTLEELMDADQVLFSKDLSPLQCTAALHTLRTHLGEMRYGVWETMPLLISDTFGVGELAGTLTVPWDFTVDQFLAFLTRHEAALEACRQGAMSFATRVEQLIGEVSNELELDDVLISCSHKEALHTLELLHRNKELLRGHGVTHVTLEVGDRYATRMNGVIMVSHTMHTVDGLRAWLRAVQPRLTLQKQLYRVSKHMLETTMWHLKEFRNMVEPGGIDAFQMNECTYAQRLEWARELYRIGGSLAQWDWSDFSFLLSPQLDIDWANRQMALPYNFDGDALVRYVEEVQLGAKQRKHEELLQASALQRAKEEADRERAHAQELLVRDGVIAGDPGDPPTAEAMQQREGYPDLPSHSKEGDSASRLKDMYRRTMPFMDEYMASSKDAVDGLTVERPLSHAVTFNSDEEAEDQLKWEGFYQAPLVDQVPPGDLDDIAHTYMVSNRWHREEAAKKLLEQLKDTYGSKGRRFDYQKMGDVLSINNARVQPKGFPTLTRGLKPGAS